MRTRTKALRISGPNIGQQTSRGMGNAVKVVATATAAAVFTSASSFTARVAATTAPVTSAFFSPSSYVAFAPSTRSRRRRTPAPFFEDCAAVAFRPAPPPRLPSTVAVASSHFESGDTIRTVDPNDASEPLPFADGSIPFTDNTGSFLTCFVDAVATIGGTEYYVGHPSDHAVDVAFEDEEGDIVSLETDDPLMDGVFEAAVEALGKDPRYGKKKYSLHRTPATLTLAGSLIDFDEDEDDGEDEEEGSADLILTFKESGNEYMLVRPRDLTLVVGKKVDGFPDQRVLISDEESEKIMPSLLKLLGL